MKFLKIILVVFFLSAHFAIYCQKESGLKLVTHAEDFKMQERVLLIFDQDFYLAGEELNFFAMTLDAGLQIPYAFSSILYLELYDQDNTVIAAKKVLLNKGEAINALDLPRETKTGYYYIRAYTNYMKNFGPSVFFTKRLKIVNPFFPNNFSFTGAPSDEYATAVKAGHGKTECTDLKKNTNTGVACKVDSVKKDTAFLSIHSSNSTHLPLSVFVENNGSEYMWDTPVNDSIAVLQLILPSGLNKITIKDIEQRIVSQQLVYIKPEASLTIDAHFNKSEASRGDSIVLDLQSHTNDSIQYLVALHLGNELTLPSLQEHIEAAFDTSSLASFANHEAKDEHLAYLPEFTHDIVTGTVKADNSNASTANKNLYLSFVDSISRITRCKTDSFGKFTAALPIDYQGKDLIISVVDTTNAYSIVCDDEFYPDFLKVIKEDYYPDPSLKPLIEARMINLQVKDAYADLKNTTINTERPHLRFYGYPDSEYKFNKYSGLPNLEEFITEVVYEALVIRRRSQVSFEVITGRNDMDDEPPLIIFDGIPLLQTDQLSPLISTEKLKSVRVVASRFFIGSEVYEGILDITSNDGSFTLVEKGENSVRTRFSPVIPTPDNNNLANIRTPQYISDLYFDKINSAGGKESIKIALPHNAGSYSLSLFGYTKNGEWGYMTLPDLLNVK